MSAFSERVVEIMNDDRATIARLLEIITTKDGEIAELTAAVLHLDKLLNPKPERFDPNAESDYQRELRESSRC